MALGAMRMMASSGSMCSISMPADGRGVADGCGAVESASASVPVASACKVWDCAGDWVHRICRPVTDAGWMVKHSAACAARIATAANVLICVSIFVFVFILIRFDSLCFVGEDRKFPVSETCEEIKCFVMCMLKIRIHCSNGGVR